jgi:hypothetical protein
MRVDGRKRGTPSHVHARVCPPTGSGTDPGRETQKRCREPRGFDAVVYRSRTPPRRADFSPWRAGRRTGYTVDLGDKAAPGPPCNVWSQPIAARCAAGRLDASRGAFVFDHQDRLTEGQRRCWEDSQARPRSWLRSADAEATRRSTRQFGLGPKPRGSPASATRD